MYKGLMGKFAIVIVGFILILSNVKPLSPVALFCGFMLVQAMSWVAPFGCHVYKTSLNTTKIEKFLGAGEISSSTRYSFVL